MPMTVGNKFIELDHDYIGAYDNDHNIRFFTRANFVKINPNQEQKAE